jgi:hypothetical protein
MADLRTASEAVASSATVLIDAACAAEILAACASLRSVSWSACRCLRCAEGVMRTAALPLVAGTRRGGATTDGRAGEGGTSGHRGASGQARLTQAGVAAP